MVRSNGLIGSQGLGFWGVLGALQGSTSRFGVD